MTVKVGDLAPDFTLPDSSGTPVHFKDLLAKGPVVLYFYPWDNTRGCTAEACSFRDAYEDFKEVGAEVVGVSSDSEASHQEFASKHGLPFVLLSDKGEKVRREYGVPKSLLGFVPGRVTYVIDRNGVVRHVFNQLRNASQHVSEAMDVLRSL